MTSFGKLSTPGSVQLAGIRKVENFWGADVLLHGETELQRGFGVEASKSLQAEANQLCDGGL